MAPPVSHFNAFLWGHSNCGSLGLGDAVSDYGLVPNPTKLNDDGIGGWTQMACGERFTVALSPNGEVFTWGRGANGRLGHEGWHSYSQRRSRTHG